MAPKTMSSAVHHDDWEYLYDIRFDLIKRGFRSNPELLIAVLVQDRLSETDQRAVFRNAATDQDERIKKSLQHRATESVMRAKALCEEVKGSMDSLAERSAPMSDWEIQLDSNMDALSQKCIMEIEDMRVWGKEKIRQLSSEELRKVVANIFGGAMNSVAILFSAAVKSLGHILETLESWLKRVRENIAEWARSLAVWVGDALDTIEKLFNQASQSLDELAEMLHEMGVNEFTLVWRKGRWERER